MPKSPSELADELGQMMPSAILLTLNDETYFDAIRGIVDIFAAKNKLNTIYISAAIPSQSIIDVLSILEVNLDTTYFVDCISHIMVGGTKRHSNVHLVESPTMLENIMLKVEYLMKKGGDRQNVIVLDSINMLAIHNSPKILSEFVHIINNNMRARNAYIVIFTIDSLGATDEIGKMMSFVCDVEMSMAKEEEK
jgi:archaellum biogenesis ATPase FlaH